jgi:DNA mismatch endonuclease (patch repair protein)
VLVRKTLFAFGFRFRLNDKRYPGKPDIVLPKYKAVIFVHGCFWHQHEGCPKSTPPESRKEFWNTKLNKNVERDHRNIEQLKTMGWRVAVVWECAIIKKSVFEQTMASLDSWIRSSEPELTIPKVERVS